MAPLPSTTKVHKHLSLNNFSYYHRIRTFIPTHPNKKYHFRDLAKMVLHYLLIYLSDLPSTPPLSLCGSMCFVPSSNLRVFDWLPLCTAPSSIRHLPICRARPIPSHTHHVQGCPSLLCPSVFGALLLSHSSSCLLRLVLVYKKNEAGHTPHLAASSYLILYSYGRRGALTPSSYFL